MDTTVLGRTGLDVSVVGLGCGGHSRLGQETGSSEDESAALVRLALELGVTYIDTARVYRTEKIVAKGIAGRRDEVVVSTKARPEGRDGLLDRRSLRESVHTSLRRLRTDRIDVFHLHGVEAPQYRYCADELVPELEDLRDDGQIRFIAISEPFAGDPEHEMLRRAVLDDCWDVMMVGFNMLNQSARDIIYPMTVEKEIGVEVMYAVRKALSSPKELSRVARELVKHGHIAANDIDLEQPFGFVVDQGAADSVVEAAYRFARHEPGGHVILTGTGNPAHLKENIESIAGPPLPPEILERIHEVFGHLNHISGN